MCCLQHSWLYPPLSMLGGTLELGGIVSCAGDVTVWLKHLIHVVELRSLIYFDSWELE